MEEFALMLRAKGDVLRIEMPKDRGWRWYGQQIGADLVENVRPRGLEEPYMMLVDEEGLLKEAPEVNGLASWLYETHKHGHPIVGDVLIVRSVETEDGGDIEGLSGEEADKIAGRLVENMEKAYVAVWEELARRALAEVRRQAHGTV